jgi:parallel beta-helix repeat protein
MVRFLLKTLICMEVFFTVASATIIEVPSVHSTIQAGIDASSDGDTVLVQPGTYVENIQITGRIVVLGSLYLTTGDISYISTTIIDGDSLSPVIRFSSCFDTLSILTGFTIRNGWGYLSGGGIHIDNAHPRIRYNTITDNAAHFAGGGIQIKSNSRPVIYGNVISGNRTPNTIGEDGGGIACYSGNATIRKNVIEENSSHFGGAMSLAISSGNPNTIVDSNTIVGNTATQGGGNLRLFRHG